MSQAPAIPHGPGAEAAPPRATPVTGTRSPLIAAAIAVIAGLLMVTVFSRNPIAAATPEADVALAPVVAAPSPWTGVPEASTVFDGKTVAVEEPAPTF